MPERLPDFLIVGAMKAGTTTIYADLGSHPRCFFPRDKEPGNLADDRVLTPAGRAAYAKLFAGASPDQLIGEASTVYTKLPDFPGCAERARRVLSADTKIIYSVRDPIARLSSQHYHELYSRALRDPDPDSAAQNIPRLTEYSRYATQIEPWIDAFGRGNVLILGFERYTADRVGGFAALCGFLGLDPDLAELDTETIHNKGDTKRAVPETAGALWRSPFYQRLVRPLVRGPVKEALLRLLPAPPPRPPKPGERTRQAVHDALRDDAGRLRGILGSGPAWFAEPGSATWLDSAAAPADQNAGPGPATLGRGPTPCT